MKVLVLGAGFAGMGAAQHLREHGIDVSVLEGSHRVGGRAHTIDFPGCGRVELGATWLHGLAGNPLYDYAVEQGLMSATADQKDEAWGSAKWVLEGAAEPLSGKQRKVVAEASGAYSAAVEASLEASMAPEHERDLTVGGYLRDAWPQARDKFEAEHRQLAGETWAWREKVQRSMDGPPSTDVMLARALLDYDELDGLNVPVPGGYQALADRMAEGLDISFGCVATKVLWGDDGVSVSCEDGRSFTADALIVTVSLGVLKATHQALFDPPLPTEKAAVIARMGFGVINKVYIVSDAPEQQERADKATAYNLMWSLPAGPDSWPESPSAPEDGPAWLQGAYAVRMKGSEFCRLEPSFRAGAATALPPEAPIGGVPSGDFKPLAGVNGASLVHDGEAATAWLSGPEALAMEERPDELLTADTAALLDAFPAAKAQLPRVRAAYRSQWGTNPLTRGSYSYPAAGSSLADIAVLAEPVCVNDTRPVLLFAGEATHPRHYGTTHGALLTGRREADRLIGVVGILVNGHA